MLPGAKRTDDCTRQEDPITGGAAASVPPACLSAGTALAFALA